MRKSFISLSMLTALSFAQVSYADDVRSVNGVKWQKTKSISPQSLASQPVPQGATSVFFIRPADGGNVQTSANIAINDRFQTSLQPGNFSQVYTCSGVNDISTDVTQNKSNDLLANKLTFNLTPQDNYFFLVNVDSSGYSTVRHISQDSAMSLMQNMTHQTHQISRVVPDCPVQPEIRPLPIMPPPVEPPVIERHSINLEVLFDTDKSVVKKQYMSRIAEVAEFMRRHPTAVVAIEGHTDSRASERYNQALSQRRVDAVRKILVERYGISADRFNSVGYGESRPVASNKTAEGRRLNRRVVAIFDGYQ